MPDRKTKSAGQTETQRIALLIDRDGAEATRAWVERTLQIYRDALGNPLGFASIPPYRPRFEASVAAFESWLDRNR